jgi:PAS domain S-box-containing protein
MPNAQTMQLSPARRRLAEPPDAGFGEAVSATPTVSDPAELELALRSLLSLHPQASISAVRADGVFVPTPEALADGHAVLTGVSALALVLPQDRAAVIAAWEQASAEGAARCPVHLAAEPERTALFYAFDLRPLRGVLVVVFTPSGHALATVGGARLTAKALPRVASVSKDERGTLIKVDEALTQILGWSASELEGRRSMEIIHPDDHTLAIENWMEMLAMPGPGRRVRLRHKRRDGAWVWFEICIRSSESADRRCCNTSWHRWSRPTDGSSIKPSTPCWVRDHRSTSRSSCTCRRVS